jgi:RimJ/RimL family protein N-acetyltransferase
MTNPILFDLPMPITTKRLIIRPMMPGDGKEVFAAVEESRPHLRLWMPWVDRTTKWEDCEETMRRFYAEFILRTGINLVMISGRRIIGSCGYAYLNWSRYNADIGYWCRSSEQGKGYATEAAAALTHYAFKQMGMKRVTILCDEENLKSRAVPERLGFTLEVTARGIINTPHRDDLSVGCRYVRFDDSGLDDWQATW